MRDFLFRPGLSIMLRLICLVDSVNRIFDARSLIGAVFLDVTKPFGIVWVKALLHKITLLTSRLISLKPHIHVSTAELPTFLPICHIHTSLDGGRCFTCGAGRTQPVSCALQLTRRRGITHVGSALRCSHPRSEMASVEFQVFSQIVTENLTRFCGFRSSPTTSQHWLKVLTQT